ncbi:hypothetical protein AVHY2522_10920 [Acidovorax sp. SUPP2522]|uniref:TubC N-terminal docking domain-related protein n=1 Tax=unclassified Acidovorax TaxID=2684926 RepID=UPI00234934A2|nr:MULTISPECIES: hypothetical protein [unclassified Acidovorax]WCM99389.1 hypothetical protein M5C96_08235 [Acidovorax sp. GBBC 1281]GKT16230.1 hypothetical protein AVHY2522_10920 [Acidovorax sp. SUPP2522]
MTAQSILAELLACGIDLECTPDGTTLTVPAGVLTPAQRAQVLQHKPELIRLVLESSQLTSDLMRAAMHVCDRWKDSPAAREQMRRDVLSTPLHLRADLLQHLRGQYPGSNASNSNPTPN